MTAPAPTRPPSPARPAWQADHERCMEHLRRCQQACRTGGLCPIAAELSRQADASGRVAAWQEGAGG